MGDGPYRAAAVPPGETGHLLQQKPLAFPVCMLLTTEPRGPAACGIDCWLREGEALGEVKGDQPQPDSQFPGDAVCQGYLCL